MNAQGFQDLIGTELDGGWVLDTQVRPGDTGGFFSVGFLARHHDGREAFAKLLNYERAIRSDDFVAELERLSRAHRFERDVLTMCNQSGLSRVVRVLASGNIRASTHQFPIPYLVFERAAGDVRSALDNVESLVIAAKLRWCHQAAVAIRQLHSLEVAHQDIKPSNLLIFDAFNGPARESKIGDLGRATSSSHQAEHDELRIPGQISYAPPELLYKQVSDDFAVRRYASDLFQLGSLISFITTSATMHQRLELHLSPEHHHGNWGDSYTAVLPFVRTAHACAIEDLAREIGGSLGREVAGIVSYLTEPDPTLRGHTRDRGTARRYSLQRVVSDLNRVAARAKIVERRLAS